MDLRGYSDAQNKNEKVKTLMGELEVGICNKNTYTKNDNRVSLLLFFVFRIWIRRMKFLRNN